MKLLCCIFLLLTSPLFWFNTFGQIPNEQKTIGLVLSGGGAKGLAHVGVLKAFEESGIPIHRIVGTSMGGIVGGMLAAGYTIAEIETIIRSEEFQEWATGQVSATKKHFFFPEEGSEASMVNFRLSLDSSFTPYVQSNVVADAPLNFALARFFRHANRYSQNNFDSLAIPFRCVGADLFTQKEIVFKSGDMADAVRATMAVPLIFRPVKIDGKYLFDGGVFNNFPVDVMQQEFDPDLIIGVDVGTQVFQEYPSEKDEELIQNPLKFLFMVPKESAKLDSTDVFLPLPVDEISPADFQLVDELIAIGYEKGLKAIPEIKEKIKGWDFEESRSDIKPIFKNDSIPEITKVVVEGEQLKKGQQKMIEQLLWQNEEPASVIDLEKRYYMLTQQSFFKDAYPHFKADSSGTGYEFVFTVNPNKKLGVSLGGNLSSRSVGAVYLGAEYTFFNRWLYQLKANAFAGAHYTSARVQFRTTIPKRSFFYWESSLTYNRWDYTVLRELFWEDDIQNDLIRTDRYADVSAGWSWPSRRNLVFSGRYFGKHDRYEATALDTTDASGQVLDLNGGLVQAKYVKNRLDDGQFPLKGQYISLNAKYIFANEKNTLSGNEPHRWWEARTKLQQFFGNKWRIGLAAEAAWSDLSTLEDSFRTLLYQPSFVPFMDNLTFFNPQLRANGWISGTVTLAKPFSRAFHGRLEHAIFNVLETYSAARFPQKISLDPLDEHQQVTTSSLVYKTPFGPLSASVNYYHDSPFNWSILFNFGFLVFNDRGL